MEIEKITVMIAEMAEYEREVLYPMATEQVAIDRRRREGQLP